MSKKNIGTHDAALDKNMANTMLKVYVCAEKKIRNKYTLWKDNHTKWTYEIQYKTLIDLMVMFCNLGN